MIVLADATSVTDFTIVTCNATDFAKVPGVRVEDWSRA